MHGDEFRGAGLVFGVLPLPDIPSWLFLGDAEEAHEIMVHAWIPLMALHAAAALWHHFARRDDVLTRMLPGSGNQTIQKGEKGGGTP